MKTAEELSEFCHKNNLGQGLTKKWELKHFNVIANALNQDESVKICSMLLFGADNSDKTINGNVAIALTNKRLIIGQKKLVGEHIISISLQNINDIYFEKKALFGYITIDTIKEKISVYSNNEETKNFYNAIQTIVNSNRNNISTDKKDDDKYEKLRKLKSLYDENIITKEEFEQEKAKLLQ